MKTHILAKRLDNDGASPASTRLRVYLPQYLIRYTDMYQNTFCHMYHRMIQYSRRGAPSRAARSVVCSSGRSAWDFLVRRARACSTTQMAFLAIVAPVKSGEHADGPIGAAGMNFLPDGGANLGTGHDWLRPPLPLVEVHS